jgi:hypothetical protein
MKIKQIAISTVVLSGLGVLIYANQRGVIHLLGIDTQQSDNYDFVSGVGPMIITFVLGAGVLGTIWRHVNCHADKCARIGRFHVAGGQFKLCGRHHHEVTGHPHKLTAELIKLAHHRHMNGNSG